LNHRYGEIFKSTVSNDISGSDNTAQYVSLNLDVFTFKGNKRREVELLESYVVGDAEFEVF